MSILYKTARNVRFVLFRKNSIIYLCLSVKGRGSIPASGPRSFPEKGGVPQPLVPGPFWRGIFWIGWVPAPPNQDWSTPPPARIWVPLTLARIGVPPPHTHTSQQQDSGCAARAVCLLHSHRMTFLFNDFYLSKIRLRVKYFGKLINRELLKANIWTHDYSWT